MEYDHDCASLMNQLLAPCANILKREPPSQENLYIVLSALAATAATIVTGCDNPVLEEHFGQMFVHNVDLLRGRKRVLH
jgi:hypothetical protein